MPKSVDLEMIREALADKRIRKTLAQVTKVELTPTRAICRVQVMTLPEQLEQIATMTWPAASRGGGVFLLPAVDDLVLIGTDEEGESYVLRCLSSPDDQVPLNAVDGSLVVQAPPGLKTFLGSDTGVYIGKGGLVPPAEPVVLGAVLQTFLSNVLSQLEALCNKLSSDPITIDSLGASCPCHPSLIADLAVINAQLQAYNAQYLSTSATNILSQTAFTER